MAEKSDLLRLELEVQRPVVHVEDEPKGRLFGDVPGLDLAAAGRAVRLGPARCAIQVAVPVVFGVLCQAPLPGVGQPSLLGFLCELVVLALRLQEPRT